jgi:hypothetical protein
MKISERRHRDIPHTWWIDHSKGGVERRAGDSRRTVEMQNWAERQLETPVQKLTHKCGNNLNKRLMLLYDWCLMTFYLSTEWSCEYRSTFSAVTPLFMHWWWSNFVGTYLSPCEIASYHIRCLNGHPQHPFTTRCSIPNLLVIRLLQRSSGQQVSQIYPHNFFCGAC